MVNKDMQRTSMFMPNYLEKLLSSVAERQGEGKARFMRLAIIETLEKYIQQAMDAGQRGGSNFGPLDNFSDRDVSDERLDKLCREFMGVMDQFPEMSHHLIKSTLVHPEGKPFSDEQDWSDRSNSLHPSCEQKAAAV